MTLRFPVMAALALTGLATAAAQATPAAASVETQAVGPAGVGLAQAERQLTQDQARLTALNSQVEQARAQVAALDRKLAADQKQEAQLHRQLGSIARYEYEQGGVGLMGVIEAGSFQQMLDQLAQIRLVGDRQSQLLSQIAALGRQDGATRDRQVEILAGIKSARDQAAAVASRAEEILRADQNAAVQAQARSVVAQAGSYRQASGGRNHFDYGYCTWYVANRRYVPWYGNAIEWWPNARAYGYAEGSTPRVGAIMVTRASSYGHVAYVESVNPDGSWTVSEMDYVGWGRVDRRTIRPGQVPLVGFIY